MSTYSDNYVLTLTNTQRSLRLWCCPSIVCSVCWIFTCVGFAQWRHIGVGTQIMIWSFPRLPTFLIRWCYTRVKPLMLYMCHKQNTWSFIPCYISRKLAFHRCVGVSNVCLFGSFLIVNKLVYAVSWCFAPLLQLTLPMNGPMEALHLNTVDSFALPFRSMVRRFN